MMITRYELKFMVSHATARSVLGVARDALVPDSNGTSARYRVTSVYFDSADHQAYWEKLDGESVRRKLRLRFYGTIRGNEGPDDRPYFLELKYRKKDTVFKERIRLPFEFAKEILADADALRDVSSVVDPSDASAFAVARSIENFASASSLRPTDTISYEREAWQGAIDERVRLTFDRVVHAYPPEVYTNVDSFSGLPIIPPNRCIMEVKFNNVVPAWLRTTLVTEKLAPRRFSKYASGLEAIGRIETRLEKADICVRSALNEPAPQFGV